jgi:hypothetical protein
VADTGSQPQTTDETHEILSPTHELPSSIPEKEPLPPGDANPPLDLLTPLPNTEDIRYKKHIDVSQYPRYNLRGLPAANGDAECKTAPCHIPR